MPLSRIPVCRPLLPKLADIAPYVDEIDAGRWYSNFGPLYRRFRDRLADVRGVAPEEVVALANATVGMTLALRALGATDGYCMVPAWTFPATPMAAVSAGLMPWFLDVDSTTWALTPEIAERALREAPGPVKAVLPVAPFGAPMPVAEWDAFSDRTGIPVVIDAAAGFDSLVVGRSPSVVSLHATKAIGIGEGGAVFSTDRHLLFEIHRLANFGLHGSRIAAVSGTNAKLGEHASAVGLAALEQWPVRREQFLERAGWYRQWLGDDVTFQPGFGTFASATCVLWTEPLHAVELAAALDLHGIETLRWWEAACPDHDAFREALSTEIPMARNAASHTLGLPMHVSLTAEDVARIARAVQAEFTRACQPASRAGGEFR